MMMILPAGCTVVFWEDGSHGQIDVDPLVLWRLSDLVHCHQVLFNDLAVGGDDFW